MPAASAGPICTGPRGRTAAPGGARSSQFIAVGGFFFQLEWGYVMAFVFFIAMMFLRPQGLLARS